MKPKYEAKVGDVVRLVGYGNQNGSTYDVDGLKGTVRLRTATGKVDVALRNCSTVVLVFPSQCRKIVVKKRRTLWIKTLPFRSGNMFTVSDHPVNADYVEFVEARKRK